MNEKGQSTIEFALSMVIALAFTFFFMQLCLFFAWGNFVHYATFMSARAYLSAGTTMDDQKARARSVIVRTLKRSEGLAGLDRFPQLGVGVGGGDDVRGLQFNAPQFSRFDSKLSWLEGVRYSFRSRLFMIPLAGFGKGPTSPSANSVTLTSESWLLREPTSEECAAYMNKMSGIYDNGC